MRLFLTTLCLALTLVLPAGAQTPTRAARCAARCRAALERSGEHVFRCQACLLDPSDGGGWLLALPKVPKGARDDESWEVRWGAVRLEAKLAHVSAEQRLGQWVSGAGGAERERACLTAVHAAALADTTLAKLLAPAKTLDPAAAPACAALTGTLRRALEVDFFALDELDARDALEHTSKALELPVARLLLDALSTRPASADALAAAALEAWAKRHDAALGRALLSVAKDADAPAMNRLLAIYSKERDEQQAILTSADQSERSAALEALSALAPLSAPELSQALGDPSPRVRLAAAVGLARGEGRSVLQAGAARLLDATGAVPLAEQLTWLNLLAQSSVKGCASLALEAYAVPRAPLELQAAALEAAADCDFTAASFEVRRAAGEGPPELRGAALRALARGPADELLEAQVAAGLQSQDAPVVAAAAWAVGHKRLGRHQRTVEYLSGHASPLVRLEVLGALAALSPGLGRARAATVLSGDAAEEVRVAAARILGELGGSQARAALTGARNDDASATVKFVAGESLRRLGY